MAKLTMYFPKGLYPQGYDPAIPGYNYNPFFPELIDVNGDNVLGTPTKSLVTFVFTNGIKAKIIGKDLKYDAKKQLVAGTVTEFQLLLNDGKTVIDKITGLNIKVSDFNTVLADSGAWGVAEFLLKGNDTLTGSSGHDDLFGFAGNDTIKGGAGSDYIQGGMGKDSYDGGGDHDFISFQDSYWTAAAKSGIILDFQAGTVTDPYGNKETLKNIESVRGSKFADQMKGSSRTDDFAGLGGADVIDGRGGLDTVIYSRDAAHGGTAAVTVDLSKGYAIDGFGQRDVLRNIEDASGTAKGDKLTGSTLSNWLNGLDGNDTISGLGGADIIIGSYGNDRLSGGSGKDTFVFHTTLNTKANVDVIADFNVPDDKIELSRDVFQAIAGSGKLTAGFFAKNKSGHAEDKNDRIIYESDTGELYYDSNGSASGGSVHFATLAKNLNVTAADFFIV